MVKHCTSNLLLLLLFYFRKIIDEAIEKGEVPSFDKYVNESEAKKKKRKNRWVKERKEAKKAIKKMGVSGGFLTFK